MNNAAYATRLRQIADEIDPPPPSKKWELREYDNVKSALWCPKGHVWVYIMSGQSVQSTPRGEAIADFLNKHAAQTEGNRVIF